MNLPAILDPVPLVQAEGGRVIRVAGTRVSLDTVVTAFENGATPEEIAQDYPLALPDVYAVITYYLQHRREVEDYLEERAALSEDAERRAAASFDYPTLRARLLARAEQARAGTG